MSTRVHTHACSAVPDPSYKHSFAGAFFELFPCASSVCVSRGEASSENQETVSTPNLGEIKCTYFSPSSQQYHKIDFPFLFIYSSSNHSERALSVQEGDPDSALSSDTASQMAN